MKPILLISIVLLFVFGCEKSQPVQSADYLNYRISSDSLVITSPTTMTTYFHVSPPAKVWVELFDSINATTYYYYPEGAFSPFLHLQQPGYIVVNKIDRAFRDTTLVAQWDAKTIRLPIHRKAF
jgi:hypothetical protein